MTAPAERLRAAADRLETLDKAATDGPWSAHERHGRDVLDEGWSSYEVRAHGQPIAEVVWDLPDGRDDDAWPNTRLIATLRPLAGPVAAWLRERAESFQAETQERVAAEWNHTTWPGCGLPKLAEPTCLRGCRCFDHPLALADAVLGEVPDAQPTA